MPVGVYPELQSAVVLCIDDDEDMLECEQSFLKSFGYTVLTAASGDKGLKLASLNWVDLVIIGHFMPEMNGQEVAIAIRRVRPLAPIILLTGPAHVPYRALKLVDALVAKDLASELLPMIAQLHGCGPTLPSCFDA